MSDGFLPETNSPAGESANGSAPLQMVIPQSRSGSVFQTGAVALFGEKVIPPSGMMLSRPAVISSTTGSSA